MVQTHVITKIFICQALCKKYKVPFVVNDDIMAAKEMDADGVHIGQSDMEYTKAREILGPDKIIGLSTHSPEQLEKANEIADLIDYIGCGPVYATNTKKTAVPVGLEYVKYATEHAKMPFVAIGGIKEHNIHEVYNAGATTIAVVSDITSADDIVDKISKLAKK